MTDSDTSTRSTRAEIQPSSSDLHPLEGSAFPEDDFPSQPFEDLSLGAQVVKRKESGSERNLRTQSVSTECQSITSRGATPPPNPLHKGLGGRLWDETFGHNTATTQASPWSSRMESNLSIDESSFNFFTQSFDTLSEAGDFRQEQQQQSRGDTPTKTNVKRPSELDRTTFRLDLPTLMPVESDASVEALSPIKVASERQSETSVIFTQQQPSVRFTQNGNGHENQQHLSPSPVWHDISRIDRNDRNNGGSQNSFDGDQRQNQVSNPFYVLRMSRAAFSGCTYLLECLQQADLCTVNINVHGSFHLYRNSKEISQREDLIIATRRVEAAICTFGGTLKPTDSERVPQAIFRPKYEIPNSASTKEKKATQYEDVFHKRYVVMASKISWEVEESPPIEQPDANAITGLNRKRTARDMSQSSRDVGVRGTSGNSTRKFQDEESYDDGHSSSPNGSIVDGPKMKYRCKLCGKPKQNHDCPNLLSLQRSIGVMVYPAVNSFTAHEPGVLTPALSQMNNFVFYDSDHSPEPSYEPPSHTTAPRKATARHPSVTPETPRTGAVIPSPQSSFSTPSRSLSPSFAAGSRPSVNAGSIARKIKENRGSSHSGLIAASGSVCESLFVEAVTLRPEHYRAVTPAKPTTTDFTDYNYPSVPLPYTERKRLSDTLFCLSREIPTISENCATILRTAREKNEWDIAVAELLTQVIVGLYCGEGDLRLDGLQQYLLKLGVAC